MHRTFNVLGRITLFLAALAFTFTGCGYRRPTQVKTAGTVTLDGEPVAQASLMFIPDSGRPASGNTNTNGAFELSSYGGNDGLPAGNYRVTVTKLVLKDKYQEQLKKLETQAEEAAESGEASEAVDVEFSDNAYKNELPEKYAELDTTDINVTITKQQEPLVISLTSE
ncbi:MAG: carboxypeptidase-like regulatory domain-containing protein [Pirellulales bacterium]|nr:carboxypeptidase-like regulatory domain-containing protein [Pirellulales bacterium]